MLVKSVLLWLSIILGSACAVYVLYLNQATVILLSLSFVIAYLLDPSIDRCERLGLSRTLAIVLMTLVVILGVGTLFLVIIPQLQLQVRQVVGRAPGWGQWFSARFMPWLEQLAPPLSEYFGITLDFESVKTYTLRLWTWGMSHLPSIAQSVLSIFQSMFTGLANFIVGVLHILLVPVLVFYLLRDFDVLHDRFYASLPPPWRPIALSWLGDIDRVVGGFLRGQLTIALILAVFYAIGLALLGVPLGALLGLISGLANLVPYMSIVVGLLPALILFIVSDTPSVGGVLAILLLYAGGQILEGVYLSPRIMGRETGLHPVVVMMAILVGGTLLGLLGIIVAVPGAAVLQVALRRGHHSWQATWPLPGPDGSTTEASVAQVSYPAHDAG
jgi:predicted PurR-regulated permease PerM